MLDYTTAETLRTQLEQIPLLLTRAHLALAPGSGPAGPRVSGATRTPPLPCRLHVLDLLAARTDDGPGPDLLTAWAGAIIDDRQRANDWTGWVRVEHRLDDEAPESLAVRYLLLHHPFAIARDYARQYATGIDRLHQALNRAAGDAIAPARPARMVCPRCQLMTMTEEPDGRRVCADPGCWVVLTRAEYERRAEHVLGDRAAA
ncbi:hypothetical protein BX265_4977 [Streptomyces sp. TLI_235]|nr:hypothetical protein [Streptomyces sp. TLI_235]PBC80141.1 hypothetical protein BX265_4977 [Streptomyces sp. TLI_235]